MVFLQTLAARYLQLAGYPVRSGSGTFWIAGNRPDRRSRRTATAGMPGSAISRGRKRGEGLPSPHDADLKHPPAGDHRHASGGRGKGEGARTERDRQRLSGRSVICYTFCGCKNRKATIAASGKAQRAGQSACVYPSQTVRNFATFINPGVDPRYGEYDLEEIIQHIHHFMRLRLNEKIPQRRAVGQCGQRGEPGDARYSAVPKKSSHVPCLSSIWREPIFLRFFQFGYGGGTGQHGSVCGTVRFSHGAAAYQPSRGDGGELWRSAEPDRHQCGQRNGGGAPVVYRIGKSRAFPSLWKAIYKGAGPCPIV